MPTRYQGSREITQALNAYINLIRASDSVVARTNPGIESRGLTMGQFGVLEALLHLGPMCQKSLGEKLLRSGGNITLVIDNLEKRGWVRRERQTDDRRLIVIHLTSAGRQLIAKVFPGHAREVAELMKFLTPREQQELRRLCRKLGRGIAVEREGDSRRRAAHRSRIKGDKQ